eukprot:gene2429-2465_t
MIRGFALLLICQLLGEICAKTSGLPVPGPVLGLAFLVIGLLVWHRFRKFDQTELTASDLGRVSDGLLGNLALFFVPAGVGVVQYLGLIGSYGLALAIALVVSTALTLLVTVFFPFRLWVYLSTTPLFWLTVTLVSWILADYCARRSGRHPLVNPVLLAIVLVASLLYATSTDYQTYFNGAQFVHFLLGPATVALGVPFYRNFGLVRRNFWPMLAALVGGSITAIVTAVGIAMLMGVPRAVLVSIAPKSVTAGVAMAISQDLGGIPSLTAAMVMVTGVIGAVMVTPLFNALNLKDFAARGFAVGLAAHGIGIARALHVSPIAGVFAGIAMGMNALITALILPYILKADARTIAAGLSGFALMGHAGRAAALEIMRRWTKRPVLVLCGPGKNGGDGFVVARYLAAAGWPVRLACMVDIGVLQGETADHAALWRGPVEPLSLSALAGAELIVDALFGAGLDRPLTGIAAQILAEITRKKLICVAIDVPSGLMGDTGEVFGAAPAALTITFFRKKPGHVLLPGKDFCGPTVVVDIGIQAAVLDQIAPMHWENAPAHWLKHLPHPALQGHKYSRGHALVAGGYPMTGAARLSARAAARIGAGLVTVAVPEIAFAIYAASLTSIMVHPLKTDDDFAGLLQDKRFTALLIGPGAGLNAQTRQTVLSVLASARTTVLDADALSLFQDSPSQLFQAIKSPCILTPHEGEFRRLFDLTGDKLSRARAAARQSGSILVLKGSDTIIAAPDGRAFVNSNAPPTGWSHSWPPLPVSGCMAPPQACLV